MQFELMIHTQEKGLYDFTNEVKAQLGNAPQKGLLNLFVLHTSASLTIQENADPSAQRDLVQFLDRLVPENQDWHEHTLEGPDDTTAHMKACITSSSLNIPIIDGHLGLGTWQGLYLWEHRKGSRYRKVIGTVIEVS